MDKKKCQSCKKDLFINFYTEESGDLCIFCFVKSKHPDNKDNNKEAPNDL